MCLKSPIIFVSPGRSGSTIVANTLMNHHKLGFPSNYQHKFPKNLTLNKLKIAFDNKFWRLSNKKKVPKFVQKYLFLPSECYGMWNYITRFDINFSRDFLYGVYPSEEEVNFIRNYFEQMLKYQGKERLSFKVTGPSKIGYLSKIFPDAKFVYVKRNLIPTINSFLKVPFWKNRGAHQLWWKGVYTKSEEEWINSIKDRPELITAFQLKKIEEIAQKEIDAHRPNLFTCHYEKFTKNPEDELLRLMNFLDLKEDNQCFDFIEKSKISFGDQPEDKYFHNDKLKAIKEIIE